MSQNPNHDDPTETAAPEDAAADDPAQTQVLPSGGTRLLGPDETRADAHDTQVLSPEDTQVLDAGDGTGDGTGRSARPDEPLSVFDVPDVPDDERTVAAAGTAPFGTTPPYDAPSAAAPQHATPSPGGSPHPGPFSSGTPYGAAPGGTGDGPGAYGPGAYGPGYRGQTGWAPAATPPAPLVRTTPRTGTIVWGFIVLAVGLGVLAVAAGARIDVGLATILLLAVAGAVLVVASVVSGIRRRNHADGDA
ncbi:hypothetical protein DNL40_00580 [Xylanimonas oleitrophica]|uniref:Uncharacterized protein n=1 Tax=Xylanimonas oleitrophica TaxID=2607479 RepID=A0A2W5WUV0_9MICO|nr:hypothetical protein [Xylanimonas oleitrophica]PZR54930.1 hypothetical protein DNL40_00580 [Xylanimonas oleitrophica]